MRIAKYRNIIVALLMLAFIGQVAASATVSCQMQSQLPQPSESHEQMMDSSVMDHSQHMSKASVSEVDITLECCTDCDCSLGGCNLFALSASEPMFLSKLQSPKSRYTSMAETQLVASLFRPPISR